MPKTLPVIRKIPVAALVRDIKNGVTDSEIREKYKLSSKGLKSALRKLVDTDAVSPFLLTEWGQLFSDAAVISDIRLFKRCALSFYLPVYDAKDPTKKGRVINVSDSGIALCGIPSKVNESKILRIPVRSNHLVFQTRCRWIKKQDLNGDEIGGFEVLKVFKGNWGDFFQKVRAIIETSAARTGPDRDSEQPLPQQPPPSRETVTVQPPPAEKAPLTPVRLNTGLEAHQSDEPSVSPVQPATVVSAEGPSVAFVQACLESDEFIRLFTTSKQLLAFIINPMSFAEMMPDTRLEMLDKVTNKSSVMMADLRKKAQAFQLAIENSALLAEAGM